VNTFLRVISVLVSVYILVVLNSFKAADNIYPSDKVKSTFLQNVEKTQTALNELHQKATELNADKASVEALQTALINARNAFKQVETILAYYDPEGVKNHLNGAPLLSIEPGVDDMNVLDPEGLQVLDELIFSEYPFKEKSAISNLSKTLSFEFKNITKPFATYQFENTHLYRAMRTELTRVFTLGVTGFDTPSSGNALPEAKVALTNIKSIYVAYAKMVAKEDKALNKTLLKTMDAAIQYLENNNDFDSFDRLTFLKEYINPLYKQLLEAQLLLGIETPDEIYLAPMPLNYKATNLFANDLFNDYYFLKLEKRYDSPQAADLGKLLFFDPVLSGNNKRSCASCHNPEKAFTDGKRKSTAMNFEGTLERNSPTLVNAIYADRFFHDLRADNIEAQTEHVIHNDKEFGTDYHNMIDKLNQSEEYKTLFAEAFPSFKNKPISKTTLSLAFAAYVKTLSGFNSEFDQYVRGESNHLNAAAQRGFNIFMGKAACGTCHFAPVFSGLVPPEYKENESEVLGVPATKDTINPEIDPDKGRYSSGIVREEAYFFKYSFKTPTVRNIALTAPYMHNGVYDSLEEVMDFYNVGGGVGLGFEVPYQTLPFDSLSLTQQEIDDVIAFMQTLTDTTNMTSIPKQLPVMDNPELNTRKIGGEY
tara:strand:+ start:22916 stop:24865 length:1950 start_codon:yes stop_codon:yes gene_type:complete